MSYQLILKVSMGQVKQLLVSGLVKSFDLLGIQATFQRKTKENNLISFNKKELEIYTEQNEEMSLYFEALKASKMGWSDNYPKHFRFYSLHQMVEHVVNAEMMGDFVECGCWKGHSSYIIAKIIANSKQPRTFHIFDSFEGGLSERQAQDGKAILGENFSSTEDELFNTLKGFDFVKTYKGWIPERFNEVADREFCFVHLDVDLYQPIKDSLEFFYPKIVKGGVIVLDDYGYSAFPGTKKATDEFLQNNEYSFFYKMPVGSCLIIK
jgi:O-methyltransferase